jgi:hypothetical protein
LQGILARERRPDRGERRGLRHPSLTIALSWVR